MKALAHWLTDRPAADDCRAGFWGCFLNMPDAGFGWLVVTLAIGTPALSFIGTFGAGADRGSEARRVVVVTVGAAIIRADADFRGPKPYAVARKALTTPRRC